MVATRPVDFRNGHDGLAALVKNELRKEPFTGTVFVFRAKRADRLKLLYWNGTGLVMAYKRLEEHNFTWPAIRDGLMTLSHAQFRVIVTRRPKYVCRTCTDGVVQAPARLIPGGLPTETTVAHVLVSKYADHLPLYRQAQIYSRQGVLLDRSTLADWVGRAAFELRPGFNALMADLKRSTKLFMDETRAPVLDPGKRKTKTGYFWALARDDRPWGGEAPPGVAFR